MDPGLLWTVIQQQAGTLGKAILEGVMNSIDAGATKVNVVIDRDKFEITDDGKGFQTRDEIENFFRTFGTPHKEGDATYGRFRMGRGQMFAFAKTVWHSGPFSMDVDIKTNGLAFDLRPLKAGGKLHTHKGCIIKGKLYDPIQGMDIMGVKAEVIRNTKYAPVPVIVNGEQVNTPPTSLKWDKETDEFYVKITSSAKGIDIYQQGVYVETIPAVEFGISGTVVTKVGFPLKVNMARNSVLRSCPLFKRLLTLMGHEGGKRLADRKVLSAEEADALIGRFASLRNTYSIPKEFMSSAAIPDVSGRRWSINSLRREIKKYQQLPSGRYAVTFAQLGSPIGDKLMQSKQALCLNKDLLDMFSDKEPQDIVDFLFSYRTVEFVTFESLKDKMNDSSTLVPEKQQSKQETLVLDALSSCAWKITRAMRELLRLHHSDETCNQRTLRVGLADAFLGWTDGKSYIALERKFLAGSGTSIAGFTAMVNVLVHEYCHLDRSSGTHLHTPEFYRLFHDIIVYHGKDLVQVAYRSYLARLEKEAGKATAVTTKAKGLEGDRIFNEERAGIPVTEDAFKNLAPELVHEGVT